MGSVIRLVAIATTALVLLGFAFFAVDEMDRGSKNQQNALANELEGGKAEVVPISPTPAEESLRESRNGTFREAVDDANDVVLAPFTGIVGSSGNTWVVHGVPMLLGLLAYGLLLGLLANMLPKQRETGGDWRAA